MNSLRRRRRYIRRSYTAPIDTLFKTVPESAVLGLYSTETPPVNSGGFVDAWKDIRGSGYGPDLVNTLTARPAWDGTNKIITFDGVDDFLRGSGFPGGLFTDHTLLIVASLIAVAGRVWGHTSVQNTASGLQPLWNSAADLRNNTSFVGASYTGAQGAGIRAIIARTFKNGANGVAGIQLAGNAEATATAVGTVVACDMLTVGASRQTTLFGAFQCKAAVLVKEGSGAYNAALLAYAAAVGAV